MAAPAASRNGLGNHGVGAEELDGTARLGDVHPDIGENARKSDRGIKSS